MKISSGATDTQYILHGNLKESQKVVEKSLSALGGVKKSVPGTILGWGKYGLNKVTVNITFTEQDNKTLMTVKAKNGSIYSSPNKSMINRLVDTIANSENINYSPDKKGIGTAPLIAMTIGFVFLLILIIPIFVGALLNF